VLRGLRAPAAPAPVLAGQRVATDLWASNVPALARRAARRSVRSLAGCQLGKAGQIPVSAAEVPGHGLGERVVAPFCRSLWRRANAVRITCPGLRR